jgi:hypothetical protein
MASLWGWGLGKATPMSQVRTHLSVRYPHTNPRIMETRSCCTEQVSKYKSCIIKTVLNNGLLLLNQYKWLIQQANGPHSVTKYKINWFVLWYYSNDLNTWQITSSLQPPLLFSNKNMIKDIYVWASVCHRKGKMGFKLCGNKWYCFIYACGKYHLTSIKSSHASAKAVRKIICKWILENVIYYYMWL